MLGHLPCEEYLKFIKYGGGTWMAQSVKYQTLDLTVLRSNPTLGSAQTVRRLLGIVFLPLFCCPSPAHTLSQNKYVNLRKVLKVVNNPCCDTIYSH